MWIPCGGLGSLLRLRCTWTPVVCGVLGVFRDIELRTSTQLLLTPLVCEAPPGIALPSGVLMEVQL